MFDANLRYLPQHTRFVAHVLILAPASALHQAGLRQGMRVEGRKIADREGVAQAELKLRDTWYPVSNDTPVLTESLVYDAYIPTNAEKDSPSHALSLVTPL